MGDTLEDLGKPLNFSAYPLRASLLVDAVAAALKGYPDTRVGFYSSLSDATAVSYWERMGGVATVRVLH